MIITIISNRKSAEEAPVLEIDPHHHAAFRWMAHSFQPGGREDAIAAAVQFARTEGIVPAPETQDDAARRLVDLADALGARVQAAVRALLAGIPATVPLGDRLAVGLRTLTPST